MNKKRFTDKDFRYKIPPFKERRTPKEKLYDPEEIEFLKAIEQFKTKTGCRFPTFSQVLAVLKSLGYHKENKSP